MLVHVIKLSFKHSLFKNVISAILVTTYLALLESAEHHKENPNLHHRHVVMSVGSSPFNLSEAST